MPDVHFTENYINLYVQKLSYLKIFAIRNLEQICCTLFLLQHRGEFDKFMSGEMKFDEITDIIHRVPLLVVITGVIIFIISFAGKIFLPGGRQYYGVS